mgnify:FL=1
MSAVCKVTVKVAAKDITVPDNLDVKLNDGNETTVEATVSPADATDVKVSYASTDEAVATVDKDGRVQVLQPGECDLQADRPGQENCAEHQQEFQQG